MASLTSPKITACAGILFLLHILASISAPDSHAPDDRYGLGMEIRGDTTLERTWVEPAIDQIASISRGADFKLLRPMNATMELGDFVTVYDMGNMRLKTFTEEGNYLTAYGRGKGREPGQVALLTDAGARSDSLIYLIDPRLRRMSFFDKNGDFVRFERFDRPVHQMEWTDDSTRYELPPPAPSHPFMRVATPRRTQSIPRWLPQNLHRGMASGSLLTANGKAIYVTHSLPVMLAYAPENTTGAAHPTPDYGYPLSKALQQGNAPPTENMNASPTLSGGVLSVRIAAPEAGHIAFDLYRIDEMEYMHSIRLPIDLRRAPYEDAIYAHGTRLVATTQDTTLTLYRASSP